MTGSPFSRETARLRRNSLWLLLARIGTQGLAVLFTLLLARRLGSAGFGEYAFIAAAIFVGNGLTTFGTDMLLIREIAARNELSGLPAALVIQLGLSAIFIALVWLSAPALPNQSPSAQLALQIYSLALIPLAFYTVFTTALRGRQLMGSYTVLNLLVASAQVVVIWLFVQQTGSIVALAVLLLALQAGAALLAGCLCTLRIGEFWQGWRFSWTDVRAIVAASAPLGWLSLLGMLYQKLSLTLLSLLAGAAVTGFFSVAQRALEAAKTGHLAAFTALYPAMAEANADPHGRQPLLAALRSSRKLLIAGAVLAALALFLFAAPLVGLLFGVGFEQAVAVLRILAWVLVPYTVNSILTLAYLAANRERPVSVALSASLLGLAGLSLYWIPTAGAVGAAWASLAAESLQMGILLAYPSPSPAPRKQGEMHEFSHLS